MEKITRALSEIQSKLHAPKNQRNDFGKYNYRNAEGIIAAFKECQSGTEALTLTDSVVVVGDRIFLKATATFQCEGESVSVDGWAMHSMQKKGMDDAQITGSCSSYARKYALCGLFAIDDSEQDPDSKDNRNTNLQKPKALGGIYKRPDRPTVANVTSALVAVIESCETITSVNNLLANQSFDEDWQKLEEHNTEKAAQVRNALDAKRHQLGE